MATPNTATTADFNGFIEPQEAGFIFDEVEKTSIVQSMAEKIPMGPSGTAISHWNGNVTAEWVKEGERKPVTKGGMSKQSIQPEKIASIFVESAEVVRANPGNYMQKMRSKVAEAIALSFDAAALSGTNTPFGSYVAQTSKAVNLLGDTDASQTGTQQNVFLQLNAVLSALVNDEGRKLRGFLLDDVAEPILNGAVDNTGRPLFLDAPYPSTNVAFREGRILGRPSILSDHVQNGSVVGYGGDWSEVVWGQVGGISYDVTDQATLDLDGSGTLTSLWQHNLVAVRVETEFGLLVNDPESFVKLTNA